MDDTPLLDANVLDKCCTFVMSKQIGITSSYRIVFAVNRLCNLTICRILTDLFENLCSHLVATIENNPELPTPLHLFEKRSGVLRVKRKLTDL